MNKVNFFLTGFFIFLIGLVIVVQNTNIYTYIGMNTEKYILDPVRNFRVVETSPVEISDCAVLTTSDSYYKLIGDVNSSGTCFSLNAFNVTLDCAGFSVNYALGGSGNGVFADSDNSVVRNCSINEDSNSTGGNHGVVFEGVSNGLIENNKIALGSRGSDGIYIEEGTSVRVKNNDVLSVGGDATGIYISSTNTGRVDENDIATTADYSPGISVNSSSNVNFTKNVVTTLTSTSYGILILPENNGLIFSDIVLGSDGGGSSISIENNNYLVFRDSIFDRGLFISPGTVLGRWDFYNVSFPGAFWSNDTSGILNVYWYLDATTLDSDLLPISNVNVTGKREDNSLVFESFSNASGEIARQEILEYEQTDKNFINYVNTLINVSSEKEGYHSVSKEINLSSNHSTSIQFLMDPVTDPFSNVYKELDTQNEVFSLTESISALGSALLVTADNVTIDCNGNEIVYGTLGYAGYGIYSNSTGTKILDCLITEGTSKGDGKHAVFLEGSDGSFLENNVIKTIGFFSKGFLLNESQGIDALRNQIETVNASSQGIYSINSDLFNLSHNSIETFGDNGEGVFLDKGSDFGFVFLNNITTNGFSSFGVRLLGASDNIISSNNILTKGTLGIGFEARESVNNRISKNKIITLLDSSDGIFLSNNARFNVIENNMLNVSIDEFSSNGGDGITMGINSESNNVTGNTVYSFGPISFGLSLYSDSNSNFIRGNDFFVLGDDSGGIIFESDLNSLVDNRITTFKPSSHSLSVKGNSNLFLNNAVQTNGDSSRGLILFPGSELNEISSNNIATTGEKSHGIFIARANNNAFDLNEVLVSGNQSYGVWFLGPSTSNTISDSVIKTSNDSALLVNSENNFSVNDATFESEAGSDIYFADDSNGSWNFINTSFSDKFFDPNSFGSLLINWYLDIVVVNETGSTLSNVNVALNDSKGTQAFSLVTNSDGEIPRQIVLDHIEINSGIDDRNPYTAKLFHSLYGGNFKSLEIRSNEERTLVLKNILPNITSIPDLNVDLVPGGDRNVKFNITVSDERGRNNIMDEALLRVSRTGESERIGNCYEAGGTGEDKIFDCNVTMKFYDEFGFWNLSVIVEDVFGKEVSKVKTIFVNQLKDISIDSNRINFVTVPNDENRLARLPSKVVNNGNYEADITITGYDLYGVSDPSEVLNASNFKVGLDTDTCQTGTNLINGSTIEVPGGFLSKGASSEVDLYYCLLSFNVSEQTYRTLEGFSWKISLS